MEYNQFNPQNNQFNPSMGRPSGGSNGILKWIGLGCSAFGTLLTVIFTIITCSRGYAASAFGKMYSSKRSIQKAGQKMAEDNKILGLSLFWIGALIGMIIAIVGLVLTILSKEKGAQLDKLAMVGVAVAAAGILYGLISISTMCSYGCSYNCSYEDRMDELKSDYDDDWD